MNEKHSPEIFISYRHEDTSDFVDFLYAGLVRKFGVDSVFVDEEKIAPGEKFAKQYSDAITSCRIFFAVIGANWENLAGQKKSQAEFDDVAFEIESAFARKDRIQIIPVFVERKAPAPIANVPKCVNDLFALKGYTTVKNKWNDSIDQICRDLVERFGLTAALSRGTEQNSSPAETQWTVPSVGSVIVGAIGGLFACVVFAFLLRAQYEPSLLREAVALFAGLLVGAVLSSSINLGLVVSLKLFGRSWYGKLFGGAVGGSLGGLIAILGAGLPYFWPTAKVAKDSALEKSGGGDLIDLWLVVIAVVVSMLGVAISVIWPKTKSGRLRAVVSQLIVLCVTAVGFFLVIRFQVVDFQSWVDAGVEQLFDPRMLAFGLICGFVAGLEVALTLLIYDFISSLSEESHAPPREATQ
ncbi:MAG TPA: toll/interleukin-1 receptor domain-containing protein [Pyrinomonadaceae bacterium]|nr:toll/interleukin-1 receptor domain-containing protein [Pyrinomonadaceae bacterium]